MVDSFKNQLLIGESEIALPDSSVYTLCCPVPIAELREVVHLSKSLEEGQQVILQRVDLQPVEHMPLLLKLLEDSQCSFILTSKTKDLPGTLRSRCIERSVFGDPPDTRYRKEALTFLRSACLADFGKLHYVSSQVRREKALDDFLEALQEVLVEVWRHREGTELSSEPLISKMGTDLPLASLQFLSKRVALLRASQTSGDLGPKYNAFVSSIVYTLTRKSLIEG